MTVDACMLPIVDVRLATCRYSAGVNSRGGGGGGSNGGPCVKGINYYYNSCWCRHMVQFV